MTTYNTYQEAKIANPGSDIYEHVSNINGKFFSVEQYSDGTMGVYNKLCNPSDYCMTVKQFLDDGYKFVEGDIYVNRKISNGFVYLVSNAYHCNKRSRSDSDCLILRAAALQAPEQESTAKLELASDEFRMGIAKVLNESIAEIQDEQSKPRTKVEYEKLTSVFQLNADEMRNGVYGWLNDDGEFFPSTNEPLTVGALTKDNLYRKVERPIEWWEDAAEFLNNANDGIEAKGDNYGCLSITPHPGVSSFGLSQDQWCDFARILLEQEGE